MASRLIQLFDSAGDRILTHLSEDGEARRVIGVDTTYRLAEIAIRQALSLEAAALVQGLAEPVDLDAALAERRVTAPIDHPDPAHLILSGTGLTHLGSAEGRDKMHKAAAAGQTDSMRMFQMGLEGGKPAAGETGVQPEWFYKGDGSGLVSTGAALTAPAFALDGGEEPEIAGVYLIGADGAPYRLGYCLANEFSDHITERGNYLWLAHSKLRPAALGAELLLGTLPAAVQGMSRILRGAATLWERPFLSGEAHMSHTLANLEHHHFKYAPFRRPGDVHVHFFGTATLSFSDGVKTEPGDVFEIQAHPFRFPLRNPLEAAPAYAVVVRML